MPLARAPPCRKRCAQAGNSPRYARRRQRPWSSASADCIGAARATLERYRPPCPAMPTLRDVIAGPWRAVLVLGVTEILAWGTLFYPPVLTVPLIAHERAW